MATTFFCWKLITKRVHQLQNKQPVADKGGKEERVHYFNQKSNLWSNVRCSWPADCLINRVPTVNPILIFKGYHFLFPFFDFPVNWALMNVWIKQQRFSNSIDQHAYIKSKLPHLCNTKMKKATSEVPLSNCHVWITHPLVGKTVE